MINGNILSAKFGDSPSIMLLLTPSSSSAVFVVHEALYDLNAEVERYICDRIELGQSNGSDDQLLKQALNDCEAILDWSWQRINTGKWSEVPVEARKVFAYHKLLKTMLIVVRCFDCQQISTTIDSLVEALDSVDHGLIMSPDLPGRLLSKVASLLHQHIVHLLDAQHHSTDCDILAPRHESKAYRKWSQVLSKTNQLNELFSKKVPISIPLLKLPVDRTIARVSELDLLEFEMRYFRPEVPVIITSQTTAHWPCMSNRRWSVEYLLRLAAWRTVPVELGSRYTDETWSQKLMSLIDFIDAHILSASDTTETGYLAQHNLFEQIPELGKDFEVPDYCAVTSLTEEEDGDSSVDINAWFGPSGTVSPLHTDPKHNLFTQIVGKKYVRLYSNATPAEQIFPYDVNLLANTSAVDLEQTDPQHEAFHQIEPALVYECILEEGEMLYIPKGWWHFVKSLDVSFSLSFWWQ